MRIAEGSVERAGLVRADLAQGEVYRYLNPEAKDGLRMVCETPEGKDGLYSVRLNDGALMHSRSDSNSATVWPVEIVEGAFVEGFNC